MGRSSPSVGQQCAADGDDVVGPAGEQVHQNEPHQQKEMPVEGTELDALAQPIQRDAAPGRVRGAAQGHQPAQHVQAVQSGDEIEEGIGRVSRQEVATPGQLPPHQELAGQKGDRERAAGQEAHTHHVELAPSRRDEAPLQRHAAHDQHAGIGPEETRHRDGAPVRHAHPHGIGADEKREKRADHGEEDSEPDLCRRDGQGFRAGELTGRPFLEPRLGGEALLRQPPAPEGADPRQEEKDAGHPAGLAAACATVAWFWGTKSCMAPGTL
jgi:hypothetical protein